MAERDEQPILMPSEPVNLSPQAMWCPRGRFVTTQMENGLLVTFDTSVNPWEAIWWSSPWQLKP